MKHVLKQLSLNDEMSSSCLDDNDFNVPFTANLDLLSINLKNVIEYFCKIILLRCQKVRIALDFFNHRALNTHLTLGIFQ